IACHGIANAEAEIDTAKGAKAAGALFAMSTYANKSVQEVQSAVGDSPRFMQLYLSKNWDFNKMVIEESVKAGFTGFFLTVDALVSG
ncbi:lactate oxidase, partial [Limosilactobacillus reuteri]